MPAPKPRDLELTRKQLLEWLPGVLPGARDLRIENLTGSLGLLASRFRHLPCCIAHMD